MYEPKSGGAETPFRPPSLESGGASAPLAPPVPTPMVTGRVDCTNFIDSLCVVEFNGSRGGALIMADLMDSLL